MAEPSTGESEQRRQLVRMTLRATGLIGVVLGGWCLWLAFSSTNRTLDMQAQQIPAKPREKVPVARITGVTVEEDFDDVTTAGGPAEETKVASIQLLSATSESDAFAAEVEEPPRTRPARKESAAWLTGTIDEQRAAAEPRAPRATAIPAWKRSAAPPRFLGPALPLGRQ
jgi:hypothetical protein